MIETIQLTKRFGDVVAVDRVSLAIGGPGVTALIGANGAGKSTLFAMIGRLDQPTSGRVTIDGLDTSDTPGAELAKRVGVLRQENQVAVRITVRELVEFGRYPHSRGRFGDDDREHVDHAIEQLDLVDLQRRRLDELSGGQRQRAFIAAVMAQDTRHVLLDEPLNNLDMRHAAHTMSIVRRLADDFARSVVVVLHDVNVAAHHADRVIAMSDGRVVADGRPAEVVTRPNLKEIYGVDVDVVEQHGAPVVMHFSPTVGVA